MSGQNYPSDGARHWAETGKSVSQTVLEESGIAEEHWAEVGLYANFLMNTSPGWRPSDAMRQAVRQYRSGGIPSTR